MRMENSRGRRRKADAMDRLTKDLIATAASRGGRCQSYFKHHFSKALEQGIGEDDTEEIITLAERVGPLVRFRRDHCEGNEEGGMKWQSRR
jgi:alkylhydroperoxidase/carboxymuconolactone decarboxylase family protein YurZ